MLISKPILNKWVRNLLIIFSVFIFPIFAGLKYHQNIGLLLLFFCFLIFQRLCTRYLLRQTNNRSISWLLICMLLGFPLIFLAFNLQIAVLIECQNALVLLRTFQLKSQTKNIYFNTVLEILSVCFTQIVATFLFVGFLVPDLITEIILLNVFIFGLFSLSNSPIFGITLLILAFAIDVWWQIITFKWLIAFLVIDLVIQLILRYRPLISANIHWLLLYSLMSLLVVYH